MPLIFYIHGRGLHFGHHEFSLIRGLHFREDGELFSKLCDEDDVRVCLLLSLEVIFMGCKLVHEFDDTLMSCSSGLGCSDLDIDEDANEDYLLQEKFRMKLKEDKMLLFKEEKIMKE
nr:phospholipase-like protein [Tanacetum cinerariifolium]